MITPELYRVAWRKSSYSGDNGGQCVEIASLQAGAAVRDSKNPLGGALLLTNAAWDQLRATAKRHDNDAA